MSGGLERGNRYGNSVLRTVTYTEMYNSVAPLGLIQSNSLIPGGWYFISDATQANSGFGGVYIQAIGTNQLYNEAIWQFNTAIKALGWIDLSGTMVAGDLLNTITVNAVNQLSAPVAFVTTYNQLAIDTAANINANANAIVTAVSIRNRVILIYKTATATVNGQLIAGTGTNFVAVNISNLSEGQNITTKQVQATYDVVTNQILNVYDTQIDFIYSVSPAYITGKTYNPIYYLKWGEISQFGIAQFSGCRFINMDFRNFYYKNCLFRGSLFDDGFNFTNTGCAMNFGFFEYCDFVRGTLTLSGYLSTYTNSAQGLSFSRGLMINDSAINLTNCTTGGARLSFPRMMNDAIINLSNSTLTLSSNSTITMQMLSRLTATSATFTNTISVLLGAAGNLTANSITLSQSLTINDEYGANNTFTLTSAAITGAITINTGNGTNNTYNFTSTTCGAITISGQHTSLVLSLNNCTFATLQAANLLFVGGTINGGAQNFTANNLIFTNANITGTSIIIPALTADFNLSAVQYNNSRYSTTLYKSNFNGTAGNGLAASDILFMRIPPNFVLSSITFEFANLAGVGCLLQSDIQTATAAAIFPATAIGALNNTVQGTGGAVVPAISGATVNYKAVGVWDYIVITPTVANLIAGNIGITVTGFVSSI